jgi:hypothetical protein
VHLIHGDDTTAPHSLLRRTWVALGAEAVLAAYWLFYVRAVTTGDTPEFFRGDGGYVLFGSLLLAFIFALGTAYLAYTALRRRRALASGPARKADVAVLVVALLVNPAFVVPVVFPLLA